MSDRIDVVANEEETGKATAETDTVTAQTAAVADSEADTTALNVAAQEEASSEPQAVATSAPIEATAPVEESTEAPETPTAEAEQESEQPVAEQADGQPVAEQADEQPAAEQESEQPVAEQESEQPVAEQESEQPVAEQANEEPAAEQANEEPAAEQANEEPAAEAATDAPQQDDTEKSDDEGGARKVRVLAVGQQVEGTVKRIADFGAFIDIGVGRDGLIHVSELSVRRVGKVTDVLNEGQPITAWIKKLDRERNRISLTLVDPNTKTIRDLEQGEIVQGTVTRIMPYGAFIDIGIGRDALLHVREMGEGFIAKPEDVVNVGDSVEARIIELSRRRGRVDLSLKGLRPEPEPEPRSQLQSPSEQTGAPQSSRQQSSRQQERAPEPEPEPDDSYAEVEALSPMEAAFKRAMEAEGKEFNLSRKKQSKRSRRERDIDLQDDIITRTLSSGRK